MSKEIEDALFDEEFTKEDFINHIHADVSDPTGVRRYLEHMNEEADYRYEEMKSLNKKIFYVAVSSLICSLISIYIALRPVL